MIIKTNSAIVDGRLYTAELIEGEESRLKVRTKGERKAYYDGYKMCGDCLEQYLTDEGKQVLKSLLEAVKTSIEIDDILEPEQGVIG